jgi:hypothetical protein
MRQQHRARLALIAVLCALCLTGCGGQPDVTVAWRPAPPVSLLSCRVQPDPPPVGADDTALADFILDLADAGADCRDKLAALGRAMGVSPMSVGP